MSSAELTNTGSAVAIYSQPDLLKEKINEWVKKPYTYNDPAQSSFVQSINRYAVDMIDDIDSFINFSKKRALRAITTKRNLDVTSLKLAPSSIAKSLGCGTLGSLASMQLATRISVAMVLASYSTPAG